MDTLTTVLLVIGAVLLILYMMKRRSRLSKDLD
jgi:hypothetical protein